MTGTCSVEGCGRVGKLVRGWCSAHYQRWQRNGDPTTPGRPRVRKGVRHSRTPEERFWAKVDRSGGEERCWTWIGSTCGTGYGSFYLDGTRCPAHRISYEWATGSPIPEGLNLDHLCRVRACVNPAHLEPVTQRENIARGTAPTMVAHLADTCFRGHSLTGENAYVRPSMPNRRQCRTCLNESSRQWRAARRAAA